MSESFLVIVRTAWSSLSVYEVESAILQALTDTAMETSTPWLPGACVFSARPSAETLSPGR